MGEAKLKRKRRPILPGDSSGTYTDKMTLDEIAANDVEMAKDAIKNASRYVFGSDMVKAMLFIRNSVDKTLARLGLHINVPSTPEGKRLYAVALDKDMETKKVRIEHRNHYLGSEVWRCGIYIFQRDELVAFISDILTVRRTDVDRKTMRMMNESTTYMVITNARLDNMQRIFTMPRPMIQAAPEQQASKDTPAGTTMN